MLQVDPGVLDAVKLPKNVCTWGARTDSTHVVLEMEGNTPSFPVVSGRSSRMRWRRGWR